MNIKKRMGTKSLKIRRCELCDFILKREMFHSNINFLKAVFCSDTHRKRFIYLKKKFTSSKITPSGFRTPEEGLDSSLPVHSFPSSEEVRQDGF